MNFVGTLRHVVAQAVATEDEEVSALVVSACNHARSAMARHYVCLQDLIQFQGREKWYEAKFCADDAPDWNPAVFLRKEHKTPGLQTVVLEIEISRDRVPIRNAYKHVGQLAAVRVNSGVDRSLTGLKSGLAMPCSMLSEDDVTS